MDSECSFCAGADVQERLVYKDETVVVFPTNIPIVPMHLLVIPRRHVPTLAELTENERKALLDMVERLAKIFGERYDAEGFNFAWNQGEAGGQSMQHLHIHVLPRKEGDMGVFEYDPRKFLYRLGSREKSPESELQAVAAEVRAVLNK